MAEHGLLVRNVFVAEVFRQPLLVEFLDKTGVWEEALDLGGVEEIAVMPVVVEGLDAEDVPCAEELFFRAVPNDEGKHTALSVEVLNT